MQQHTRHSTLDSRPAARFGRAAAWLFAALMLSVGGCNGIRLFERPPRPAMLPDGTPLPELLAHVNRNADAARALISQDVTITANAAGERFSVDARIAMEKPAPGTFGPTRFRLIARTGLTGNEVDIGSNDEQFWFWFRRGEPPALYFCRHDEYGGGSARLPIPAEPEWVVEALGLRPIPPGEVHQGPFPAGPGRVEIRTARVSPQGELMTKATILDTRGGYIVEQHLYDAMGRHVAGAVLSDHQRDPVFGVVLPHTVELTWPEAQFSMRLRIGQVTLNHIPADRAGLWQPPSIPGYPAVNLSSVQP